MTQQNKNVVYRAGFIPYIVEQNGTVKMMFMIPSNPAFGGDKPQIAKGKIDPGEDAKTAALREAKEELGLFIGNIISIEELGTFLGRTTIYIGKVKRIDMFGEPTFETAATKWLTVDEFMEQGRDLHKPIVKAAHRQIIKKEGLE